PVVGTECLGWTTQHHPGRIFHINELLKERIIEGDVRDWATLRKNRDQAQVLRLPIVDSECDSQRGALLRRQLNSLLDRIVGCSPTGVDSSACIDSDQLNLLGSVVCYFDIDDAVWFLRDGMSTVGSAGRECGVRCCVKRIDRANGSEVDDVIVFCLFLR